MALLGGISASMAVILTHPIDTLKVRYQVANELTGIQPHLFDIAKNMKWFDFYRGLTGALIKQSTYTTIRVGVFKKIREDVGDMGGAMIAGGVGAFMTTPIDKTMISQQSAGGKGFGEILVEIGRKDGIRGLWKNGSIQTVRASFVTVGQFPTFYYMKDKVGDFGAGMMGGLAAATFAAPFDIMKTRLMSADARGKHQEYREGIINSFVKTFQKDGLNVFRRGVLLTWMRLGPQSTLMLMILSKLEKYFYETHDASVSN